MSKKIKKKLIRCSAGHIIGPNRPCLACQPKSANAESPQCQTIPSSSNCVPSKRVRMASTDDSCFSVPSLLDNSHQQSNVSQNTAYKVVPNDTIKFTLLKLSTQRQACSSFGIRHVSNPYSQSTNRNSLHGSRQSRSIPGEGDCLFKTFAYCISGEVNHSLIVRNKICDFIKNSGDTLQFSIFPHTDPTDYIQSTGMENPSTYGSETEILAFTMISGIEVLVYSQYHQKWLRFSPNFNRDVENSERIYVEQCRTQSSKTWWPVQPF